jgi:hypothetical protein
VNDDNSWRIRMAAVIYDIEKLKKLWKKGLTHIEIADALGCPVAYVSQLRERHKLPPRRRAYHGPSEFDPTPAQIEERKRELRERHLAEMRAMG